MTKEEQINGRRIIKNDEVIQVYKGEIVLPVSELKQLIVTVEKRTAKAFGGCTNCYGKGYATVIERAVGHGEHYRGLGDVRIDKELPRMRFCDCERGKALRVEIDSVEKRERERIVSIPIIQEFIESTKIWYEELTPAFRKGKCIMCGHRIHKQKELCDALKAITNINKD